MLFRSKVRTVAVRADGTEDPKMDPQEEDEVLPPDKEGEGDNSEHQEEQLDVHMEPQYQWCCDKINMIIFSSYHHITKKRLKTPEMTPT